MSRVRSLPPSCSSSSSRSIVWELQPRGGRARGLAGGGDAAGPVGPGDAGRTAAT